MFLLIFTAILLYLIYSWIRAKPPNFPPGLPYVPLLGSLPFMPKTNTHLVMQKWREQYGGLVGLVFGMSGLSVAVCDPKLVKEVLKRNDFLGRPFGSFLTQRSFGKRIGIMFADGLEWREQRTFALRQLKELGFGKTSMESVMLEEVEEFIEEIRDQTKQVSGLFNISSINVLWGIVAGNKFKHSDARLQELMRLLTAFFRSGNPTGNLKMLFPFLKYIIPNWNSEIQIASQKLNTFFAEIMEEHKKTRDEKVPRDFIDVYISEMISQNDPNSSFHDENLITVVSDLFSAGSESTGNTLGFALLYMVLYPDVQQEVHSTIDSIIGKARPSLQDRQKLTYIEAVIMEIQRCNTIAPITIPHRAMENTTLNGYYIPKNTILLPSIWSVLTDKEHWGDPENFRPSRFIDETGALIKDDAFIPFGLGKRLCPGEALARNMLFIFFTSIMQEFTIQLPPGSLKPSTESLPGFTTAPKPFEVIFKSRR